MNKTRGRATSNGRAIRTSFPGISRVWISPYATGDMTAAAAHLICCWQDPWAYLYRLKLCHGCSPSTTGDTHAQTHTARQRRRSLTPSGSTCRPPRTRRADQFAGTCRRASGRLCRGPLATLGSLRIHLRSVKQSRSGMKGHMPDQWTFTNRRCSTRIEHGYERALLHARAQTRTRAHMRRCNIISASQRTGRYEIPCWAALLGA